MNGRNWLAAISFAALAAILGATPSAQAAKLYKWIDEEGNVTYSQRKPPDREAETIRLRSATLQSDGARERLDRLNDQVETQEKDRDFAENSASATRERDERMANNCEVARENMRILKTTSRIQAQDASGEPYFLDEAGVQAKIEQSQRQIDDNCR